MIQVTLDANVLASGSLAVAGPIATLIEAWRRGELSVVLSVPIVVELERALDKPYVVRRLDPGARKVYLRLVRVRAAIIPITTPIPSVVSEYPDNLVLATAESGGVAYLVTGDAELPRLGALRNRKYWVPGPVAALIHPLYRFSTRMGRLPIGRCNPVPRFSLGSTC